MSATILICLLHEMVECRRQNSLGTSSARLSVLDLGCGIGHSTFLLKALLPGARVVAADWDFGNLRLLRSYFCAEASLVCLDAELPLPFANDHFDACLGLDGLHYIRSKVAILKELDRVLRCEAIWLFPHMHSALRYNEAEGVPLPPAGWARLLEFLPLRLIAEADLIEAFVAGDSCDLTQANSTRELDQYSSLAAVATRDTALLRRFEGISRALASDLEILGWNPIWYVEPSPAGASLLARWPNDTLRRESEAVFPVLPARREVPEAVVDNDGRFRASSEEGLLRDLLRNFVAVPLPLGYRVDQRSFDSGLEVES